MKNACTSERFTARCALCKPMPTRQAGLTLVELLVAMAISAVIAIAAISALIVSRQGFTTVDAASQLRENARFATDLIQRLGVQAGFLDVAFSATTRPACIPPGCVLPDPNVNGFNNAKASPTAPYNTPVAWTASDIGRGSDVLILRYQAAETFSGSGVLDNTMIDCAGNPATAVPQNRDDRMVSVLHVAASSDGEPSLMCTTPIASGGFNTPQPVVRGVESFQVLYGVSGVTPGTAPTGTPNSVPDRYLRADQMVVPSNLAATNENWKRVRSLRIGMVLRGPVGSAQESLASTYYPLGLAKDSATGTPGSAMSSANDPGTVFTPGADTRLRQTVTFTLHLRNNLGL